MGPGSYGSRLARHLSAAGEAVVEVGRPSREHRAHQGKSDPADARAAAAAVFAGDALGRPKSADGSVEMIRTLRPTRCVSASLG
jgi:transposase